MKSEKNRMTGGKMDVERKERGGGIGRKEGRGEVGERGRGEEDVEEEIKGEKKEEEEEKEDEEEEEKKEEEEEKKEEED